MDKIRMNGSSSVQGGEEHAPGSTEITESFAELERGVHTALETYSNVHRGSGHTSMVSTHLFEQARNIVLEYLGLNKRRYVVIFCTPRRALTLMAQLKPESYIVMSCQDIGLPLGVRALAVRRKMLPGGNPFQTGGGTTRLISQGWIIWASAPDKFEAGTPAIINIIAYARALRLIRHFGNNAFRNTAAGKMSALEILRHDELDDYSGRKLLDELKHTLIGRSLRVPTIEGVKSYINLDNGASTPTFTPVWNAVCQTWRQSRQIQQEIIHEVRSICSEVLGAPLDTYDIIFTSNTTEAINLVAESMRGESEHGTESVILNTLLEHNSNDLPWRMIPSVSLIRLEVDAEGFIDLNVLDTLMREYNHLHLHGNKRIKLVAMSGASNVLGVFNDLEETGRIAHRYGALLLVDAAQLVAHRKVEMERCGIDYLAFSAHKVYAPFGSGVLVVRKGLLNFNPAEMELIRLSGEENTGGIAALGKALILLQRIGLNLIRDEEQALTRRALMGMAQVPGLRIHGIKDPSSPMFARKGGVISFDLKGMLANKLAKELAERGGIGIRYGCHCAHMLVKHMLNVPSFLEQFQWMIAKLSKKITFPGVARVSLGIGNCEEDIDTLIHMLGKIARQRSNPGKKDIRQQMNDFVRITTRKVYNQLK